MSTPVVPKLSRGRALLLVLAASGLGGALGGCGGKAPTQVALPDCDGVHLLVFTTGRNQTPGQQTVVIYDLDQGGFRALLDFGGNGQDSHPAITSEGKAIAVERPGAGTGQDIQIYDRCAGGYLSRPELVTAADETEPTFSHDTSKLAFVRDTLGVPRIRLYDGGSRKFVPLHMLDSLAASGFNSRSPSLDQTGGLIAFVTGTAPTRDIGLYSRAGDSLETVLAAQINTANDEIDPCLTPDGRYLAFASNRPGGVGGAGTFDIYLFDLQARTYVAVDSLNSAGNDVHPTMSTDASFIVFQSDRTTPPAKGKWDLFDYDRIGKQISQAYQESSTEDDLQPCLAWP
jgi:Tol biopolymer transport system component